MTPALDTFEQSLVAASRALHASDLSASIEGAPAAARSRRPGRELLRRLRSLGALAQAGVAIALLTGCAGVAVAGYVLLAGSQARQLPSFECEVDGWDAITNAVTGSPIADCRATWPSASGGREASPPLAIWGVTNGQQLVAVVRPVRLGPPRSERGLRWARLPDTWTVDLPIVALQDQLDNIDTPFRSLPGECSYVAGDFAAVRSLLTADGLSDWKVQVQASEGEVSGGCRPTAASVLGPSQTVLLSQMPAQTAGSASSPAVQRALQAHNRLVNLYREVSRRLSSTCVSVPAAARLWISLARTVGYRQATLAWWHQINAGSRAGDDRHFTLYEQPAWQHTGQCAHVLVMAEGGGLTNVYVARIHP
jgi:hypothetical protein